MCIRDSCGSLFFSSIPTVFREMAKFVHFILRRSRFFSPTFNHTPGELVRESAFQDYGTALYRTQHSREHVETLEVDGGFALIAEEGEKFDHPLIRCLGFMDEITPLLKP